MAVSLVLKALLYLALSLILLILEDLALLDQTFVNNLVSILRFSELDSDSCYCLNSSVSGKPAYVSNLYLGYK